MLDDRKAGRKVGNIYFTTGEDSVKARNIRHNNNISLCVDDQEPPFSFLFLNGNAKIFPYKQKEVLKWAIKIAERHMGKKKARVYGRINGGEGSVLARIKPKKIIAEKDIAILS